MSDFNMDGFWKICKECGEKWGGDISEDLCPDCMDAAKPTGTMNCLICGTDHTEKFCPVCGKEMKIRKISHMPCTKCGFQMDMTGVTKGLVIDCPQCDDGWGGSDLYDSDAYYIGGGELTYDELPDKKKYIRTRKNNRTEFEEVIT